MLSFLSYHFLRTTRFQAESLLMATRTSSRKRKVPPELGQGTKDTPTAFLESESSKDSSAVRVSKRRKVKPGLKLDSPDSQEEKKEDLTDSQEEKKEELTDSQEEKKEELTDSQEEKKEDSPDSQEEKKEDSPDSQEEKKGDSSGSLEEKKESSDEETSLVSKPLSDTLSIVSWNVNGSNAWTKSGAWKYIPEKTPDVICLQEVKASQKKFPNQLKQIKGYKHYLYSAQKEGYAGTAILSRVKPLSVAYGIGIKEHDAEGRVITAEFDNHFLVTSYTPNSGRGLVRLKYRQKWDADFKEFLCALDKKKPVILCGDLNVAHEEIDLANPASNRNKTAGFTDEEREGFTQLLKGGFVDSYRKLYPDKKGAYTWWSYMNNARSKKIGWRLDYFVLSERMMDDVEDVVIQDDVVGSDHCPLLLKLGGGCL